MSDHEAAVPEFIACALQVSCNGVNLISDIAEARERIAGTIEKIGGYAKTIANFLPFFYGVPCRLVALPEYAVTGFDSLDESLIVSLRAKENPVAGGYHVPLVGGQRLQKPPGGAAKKLAVFGLHDAR